MLSLALYALLACGPSFNDIRQQNTIEAYETWLATAKETDPNYRVAMLNMETLYLEQARAAKTLEAYNKYADRFKNPKEVMHYEEAMKEREEAFFKWSEQTDTVEGWQKFLDENPKGEKKRRQDARDRIEVAQYRDKLEMGPIKLTEVNLAENPEGPKDGWGIECEITNKGEKSVSYLNMEVRYKNAEGKTIETDRWPWVAQRFPVPMEEELKVPVKPGEKRKFYYTTAPPEAQGWAQKVELMPLAIRFEGAAEAE